MTLKHCCFILWGIKWPWDIITLYHEIYNDLELKNCHFTSWGIQWPWSIATWFPDIYCDLDLKHCHFTPWGNQWPWGMQWPWRIITLFSEVYIQSPWRVVTLFPEVYCDLEWLLLYSLRYAVTFKWPYFMPCCDPDNVILPISEVPSDQVVSGWQNGSQIAAHFSRPIGYHFWEDKWPLQVRFSWTRAALMKISSGCRGMKRLPRRRLI